MAENHVISLKPMKPWTITKNVVIISLASMVNFTAFTGTVNLQSSINSEAGLGTASLAALYSAVFFSNTFLTVSVIKWLGIKWTITLSFLMYMPYIAAQMYPTFYTMIPAAILLGLGCGPLWAAKFTYISMSAEAHNRISDIPVNELLTRFFGIFFMIFPLNQVWGNLISSLVLTSGNNVAAVTSVNETMIPIVCGADFMPSTDTNHTLPEQPSEKIWLLSGIYLTCMAGAAFIAAVGLDSLNRCDSIPENSRRTLSTMEQLALTLKVMMEPGQMLLIVITIFMGLEQAFFSTEFAAAFVSCAVGTGYIGFIFMANGLSGAIGSLLFKYFAKMIHRIYVICTAASIHAALLFTMLIWRPHAGEVYILYIIAILWGLSGAMWQIQLNTFYAILSPGREEAAYSNSQIWHSLGFIILQSISPYYITSYKTYLLLATLLIGMLCYAIAEYQQNKIKKEMERKRDSYLYTSINSDQRASHVNKL